MSFYCAFCVSVISQFVAVLRRYPQQNFTLRLHFVVGVYGLHRFIIALYLIEYSITVQIKCKL